MGTGHDHGPGVGAGETSKRRLAWMLGLVTLYMIAEVIGGVYTNSLALLADAGHMLSDAGALGLALFAIWFARRPSGAKHTYGYYRTEILAALANGATLVAISLFILYEAWQRFESPPDVEGPLMMGVAVGGLIVNGIGLVALHSGREESLNVKGAWLHVLTDALGSVQAIAAGALIWAFGWNWADPVASVLIALLVIYSAWQLLRETTAVLMESAPGHLDVDEVRDAMVSLPGVVDVHDLHIWTITSGLEALSAHAVVEDGRRRSAVLKEMRGMLHDRFGIDHVTIQIEPEDFDERETAI